LGDDIGRMLGDYVPDDVESPEPDTTSAAGTTPAEPATGTETETPAADGAAGDAAAPDASDGTTPDTPTASAADETDPFADTTPATFTVNGQSVTNEGIRVFKEGGAVIRPDALPDVLQKLSERESLQARNHSQSLEYQTLAKATEWVDQSSGKTYTGPEAAIEMRIGNASLFAENQLLVQAITDPEILARCLTTAKGADGVERVVFSPDAIEDLKREVSLQQRELASKLREYYKGVMAEAAKPAPAPIDYPKATDSLITALAADAKLDASVLTPGDRTLLAKQLPFHIKDGLASVEWQELVKDRIQERVAHKTNAAQIASTTADATKKGLANMAAAARGVKPNQRPVAPVAPPKPVDDRAKNESDIFDSMLFSSAAALRSGSR
jgi:hypothetical protein